MHEGKIIGFNPTKIAEQIMAAAVEEQNRRLVEFAKEEIKKLGDKILTYNSANHMDRTGNLLNSLCWVVTYNGNHVDAGYYRAPKTNSYVNRWGEQRGLDPSGSSDSYLHEWSDPTGERVEGRRLADEFVKSYKGVANKWTVCFAVLAPYWGYWESGFTMRRGGSTVYQGKDWERKIPRSSHFYQFQVMTHIYDDVRMALKPATSHINVYVPPYSYKARSQKGKKYKNKPFTKKLRYD